MLKHLALLGLRAAVGGYVAVHGAQKLFGAFEGPGLEGTAGYFESLGLEPGRQMAVLGGGAELVGGTLTATGILHPLGPVAVAGVMTSAASTHVPNGPFASNGGFELPVTNLAAALALAALGPGALRLGPRLSPVKATVVTLATAGLSAYAISRVLAKQGAPSPQSVAGSDAAAVAVVEAEMVAAELDREARIEAEIVAEAQVEAQLEAELEAEIEAEIDALTKDEGPQY